MKALVIFLPFVITASALTDHEQWISFKSDHGKIYKSIHEDALRFRIFQDNLRLIESHNAKYERGEETYMLGVNQFADLTQDDFENKWSMTDFQPSQPDATFYAESNTEGATSVDWREKGAVTDVLNQGDCSSCWTFSTVGSLEGQNAIKHNNKIALSPQELLDCSGSYGTKGCKGGWMYDAYRYVKDHGISALEDYHYDFKQETCRNGTTPRINLSVTGYTRVDRTEEALQQAVEKIGPISTTLYDGGIALYSKGILNPRGCPSRPTHAVLVVGYGTENGIDYWIMKNSWGSNWGENGYFRIIKSKKNNNPCGIYDYAMYPNVA